MLARPRLLAQLFEAMQSGSPGVRMRAADAAEKISRLHPAWLAPYKRLLINSLTRIPQQEVRWHVARMLPRLKLSGTERKKVFGLLLRYLKDESRIVKTCAMQAIAELALQDDSCRNQALGLIRRMMINGSPAMKAARKKTVERSDHGSGRKED